MYNNNSDIDIDFGNVPARDSPFDYKSSIDNAFYKLMDSFQGTKYDSEKFSKLGMGMTIIPYHYKDVINHITEYYWLGEIFLSNIHEGTENVIYSTVANIKQEIIF